MKEDKEKFKRTNRHYCSERKCSECELVKGMPYECCFHEIVREKIVAEQEATNAK